jgi:hypothetical protein
LMSRIERAESAAHAAVDGGRQAGRAWRSLHRHARFSARASQGLPACAETRRWLAPAWMRPRCVFAAPVATRQRPGARRVRVQPDRRARLHGRRDSPLHAIDRWAHALAAKAAVMDAGNESQPRAGLPCAPRVCAVPAWRRRTRWLSGGDRRSWRRPPARWPAGRSRVAGRG